MKTNAKNRKRISAALAACMATSMAIGSLALFTDRFQAHTEVTAGTLDLQLTENWQADNAEVTKVFKPGEAMVLDYSLKNAGNMAANVRETFVLSTSKEMNAAAPELNLYAAKDVDVDASGNATIHAGAQPIKGTFAQDKISYQIDQFTLNGSGEKVNGVTSDAKAGQYVLVFDEDADNGFQEVDLKIEYLAQGLQHGNSGDDTWEDARVISETVTIGGENINVVPELK